MNSLKSVFYTATLLVILSGCNREDKLYINTCLGVMAAENLGKSLTHEHILVDFIGADSTGYHRWYRDEVVTRVFPYLEEIRKHGYLTLFECTPAYLGRDPFLCRELSKMTGLNIITNTGYYGAMNNKFLPGHVFSETADQIAERWIEEFKTGIDGSGVKPGFIKIAIERDSIVSVLHEKIVRAASRTHLATGMTIASHTGPSPGAYRQAEILKEEGVSPEAFIWVHALEGPVRDNINLAKQGMWISYDNMNDSPKVLQLFLEHLQAMKKADVLNKVLLSHDAGWYSPGQEDGGTFRSFTSIEKILLPALREQGFTKEEIYQLMIKNPEQAFGIRVRPMN